MASRQERGRGGHCRPEEDARRPGAARPPAAASARPAGGGLPLLAPRRRAGAIAALRGSRRGGTAAKQPPRGAWAGGGSAAQKFPGSSAGSPRRRGGGGRGRTPLSQPARALRSAPRRPPAAKFHSETPRLRPYLHGNDPLVSLRSPRDEAEAGSPVASRGDGRQTGRARRALGRSGRRHRPGRDGGRRKGQAEPRYRDTVSSLPPAPGEVCRLPQGEREQPLPPGPAGRSASSAGPPRAALPAAPPERRICSAPGSAPPGSGAAAAREESPAREGSAGVPVTVSRARLGSPGGNRPFLAGVGLS
ncbi:translation initiation factor IF-2-like [Corvus kubaryi]|uniref:translation initiation factor IF-2-like n=1 Tax=Corvus kubaryi TaxID=68294 RepID=UPI001C0428BC|nr:translation initiation factor IF-2-like [Corvus kubaryi]